MGTLTTLVELDIHAWTFAEKGSPDGKSLAFSALNWVPGRITLMRMDLATGEVEQLWIAAGTDDEQSFGRFHWLPDRSGLIGTLEGLDKLRMARFDMATRTMTMLSDWMVGWRVSPTMELSRDGKTIAYNTQDGELRFITLAGAPAPGFPTHLHGLYPAFSPDGKLLAYSKLVGGPNGQIDGVWIFRFSDGATWRLLPEGTRLVQVLDWE